MLTPGQIAKVLEEHRAYGDESGIEECGCKATPPEDAWENDHGDTLWHEAHVAEQIAALLPKVTETVEWGVQVTSDDPDYVFPLPLTAIRVRDGKREVAERMVARSPETRTAVTRTRRTYADEVSEWTEATS